MTKIASVLSNDQRSFKKLVLNEKGYEVKCGLSHTDLESVYRLRARVFCNELGWVGSPHDEHETDVFDDSAIQVALFKGNDVIACLRIHPNTTDWMACTVFRDLPQIPSQPIKTVDACEVSRLALAPEFRRQKLPDGSEPIEALYRGLFAFCTLNQIRYVYMITSLPVLRALRHRGLPCEEISKRKTMEDGVIALAARLDWVQFFEVNRSRNPNRLNRFIATLAKTTETPAHSDKIILHSAR